MAELYRCDLQAALEVLDLVDKANESLLKADAFVGPIQIENIDGFGDPLGVVRMNDDGVTVFVPFEESK